MLTTTESDFVHLVPEGWQFNNFSQLVVSLKKSKLPVPAVRRSHIKKTNRMCQAIR